MLNDALKQKASLFRPVKPSSPTETQIYVKATLERVKLASSSKGFRVSSSGETQKNSFETFCSTRRSGAHISGKNKSL